MWLTFTPPTILLVLLTVGHVEQHADAPGYGPWHLGMSKEDVQAASKHGPYKEVPSTKGIETENGLFDGRKTNISFVFGEHGLKKIQIWAYEGKDRDEAVRAWHRVYEYLGREHGAVEVDTIDIPPKANAKSFSAAVCEALAKRPAREVAKFKMAPSKMPEGISVFSSIFRHPKGGYFVFLYFQEP